MAITQLEIENFLALYSLTRVRVGASNRWDIYLQDGSLIARWVFDAHSMDYYIRYLKALGL